MELKNLPKERFIEVWDKAIKASGCFDEKMMVFWEEYKNGIHKNNDKLKGCLKKLVNFVNEYKKEENFSKEDYNWDLHMIFSDLEYSEFTIATDKIQEEINILKKEPEIAKRMEEELIIYNAKLARA